MWSIFAQLLRFFTDISNTMSMCAASNAVDSVHLYIWQLLLPSRTKLIFIFERSIILIYIEDQTTVAV